MLSGRQQKQQQHRDAVIKAVVGSLVRVWDNLDKQVIKAEADLEAADCGAPFPSGEAARELCTAGRLLLRIPATRDEIAQTVKRFDIASKWAGPDTVSEPADFLGELFARLEQHRYPAMVIDRAIRQVTEDFNAPARGEWSAGMPRIIEACEQAGAALWGAIHWLEAPISEQMNYSYTIRFMAASEAERRALRRAVARELADKDHTRRLGYDPAPPVSIGFRIDGQKFERISAPTLGVRQTPQRQVAPPAKQAAIKRPTGTSPDIMTLATPAARPVIRRPTGAVNIVPRGGWKG